MSLLQKISAWLSKWTPGVVAAAAVVAYFLPGMFGWVRGNSQTAVLGLIMLTMGLTLSLEDFRIMFSRPMDIFIGAVAQYTIMPLLAWSLSRMFHLDPFMSVGLILVGCCPGGVSSNIMSFLCRGDVAYSVGMTTASTLLSPFVTPLLVLRLAGAEINVDAMGMFLNILYVTLLPVSLGVLVIFLLSRTESLKRWNTEILRPMLPVWSVLCLACIVGGVIFTVRPQLMEQGWRLIALTLAVVTCHNFSGYLLGYGVACLYRFPTSKKRTLSIEVGMQNAGMATVLSRNFFANPAVIALNPMAALAVVPCAVSCAYHSISGTLVATYFLWRDSLKKKE